MIQERFNELQPYLRGVKLAGEYSVVECILKNTWKIDGIVTEGIQYKSGKESEEHKGYVSHMFWGEDSIDNLVNALEVVVNTNIEMEQKQALLRSKVEELKRMFEDKSLDELKGLKFSSEMDVTLKVKKPETSQIIKEEEISKNGVTEKV
jgi:hypothetical protein